LSGKGRVGKTKESKEIYLFLFSDFLLFSKRTKKGIETLQYEEKLQLDLLECTVNSLESSIKLSESVSTPLDCKTCFQLENTKEQKSFLLQAPSANEKRVWVTEITKAIEQARKAQFNRCTEQ